MIMPSVAKAPLLSKKMTSGIWSAFTSINAAKRVWPALVPITRLI
ncbi:Uncharacterised protein [Vibrio cholerae]|nr:Uncharacterised protein [Vibrio cholerae]